MMNWSFRVSSVDSNREAIVLFHGLHALAFSIFILFALPLTSLGQVKRVVIFKSDGLPHATVDRFVRERDPRTGKSQLPWFEHVFYKGGARLSNFYVRGMSLSGPSWSLLETGQHLQIKGNVEFDRYTQRTYDYLNFIPFVVNTTRGTRVDMPAAEVLDSIGEPLLIDAYAHDERHISFSLFQRGPRFITYQKSLENFFKRPPRELFDEWTMGLGMRDALPEQLLRELIEKLEDPKLKYLDLSLTDFDHAAHHNNDRETHLLALKHVDNIVGQIWTAIQKSAVADETAFIIVSDHGVNSSEGVYSQGYNLVKLLGSTAGGGHHVVTKRRLLLDYAIKGMNPFISLITTTTRDSQYLQGQSTDYPTVMLDFDGNERASIHLRNSDLNQLHILLQQLGRRDLPESHRKAATNAFFQILNSRRPAWQQTLDEMKEEMGGLRRSIELQRKLWDAQPKKFTKEELAQGRDDESKRVFAQLNRWISAEQQYSTFVNIMTNLLALHPETFDPGKIKIEQVIAKRAMGDRNTIHQLQNYVVGLGPAGLVLNGDGNLNLDRSFRRINYFSLLQEVAVRNNVQPGVSNRPIDIVALRVPSHLITQLDEANLSPDAVWVYGGPDKQALILARHDERGLSFRYQPIRALTQDASGEVTFEQISWGPGLPLKIFEDEQFAIPLESRERWLSEWHTDVDWLHALHRTKYSNGLIGLYEELAQHRFARILLDEPGLSRDEMLMRRFVRRQRELVETDMLLVANNHWNFDVRGFNPGGNHGSFFRVSTHSTFMIAGGEKTNLPKGVEIQEPYDSLSFVPTVLAITGKLYDDSNPIPVLWQKGFRRFPGRVIYEIVPEKQLPRNIAVTGEAGTP
jgi:hypothetical protein